MTEDEAVAIANGFSKHRKAYTGFMSNVIDFFHEDNEMLQDSKGRSCVHSLKSRVKNAGHLKDKILRKSAEADPITNENLLTRVTDFCGVRVMHLRRNDFAVIHKAIKSHINDQHWFFAEEPKAYTWDPEYRKFFEEHSLKYELKESFYTSVHYLVKPNSETSVVCEIQVRSLFEEIWGEIDHDLNYPHPTSNIACSEQIKVLAKLVGAGTRLVDSIYASIS